jgi:hypothetical protein
LQYLANQPEAEISLKIGISFFDCFEMECKLEYQKKY